MPKLKKRAQPTEKPLDRFSDKKPRGRPGARASEIVGRAYSYHLIFGYIWDEWGSRLLAAKNPEELSRVLKQVRYASEAFPAIAELFFRVLHEAKFPKGRQARINFLADSLAARGQVSPRRSRDICGRARASERAKSPHKIIRKEFYIECECGYKGPARDDACRKCGAKLPLSFGPGPLAWLGR